MIAQDEEIEWRCVDAAETERASSLALPPLVIRDVPVSGQRGPDWHGMVQAGADMGRHSPGWASRSEGSGLQYKSEGLLKRCDCSGQ